jgi:hypothetical protein
MIVRHDGRFGLHRPFAAAQDDCRAIAVRHLKAGTADQDGERLIQAQIALDRRRLDVSKLIAGRNDLYACLTSKFRQGLAGVFFRDIKQPWLRKGWGQTRNTQYPRRTAQKTPERSRHSLLFFSARDRCTTASSIVFGGLDALGSSNPRRTVNAPKHIFKKSGRVFKGRSLFRVCEGGAESGQGRPGRIAPSGAIASSFWVWQAAGKRKNDPAELGVTPKAGNSLRYFEILPACAHKATSAWHALVICCAVE